MENSPYCVRILKDVSTLLKTLMERIEHPEVAELFERTRDFIDDTDPIIQRIMEKEKTGNLQ